MNPTFIKANLEHMDIIKDLMLQAVTESPEAYSFTPEELRTKSEFWWSAYLEPYINSFKGQLILGMDNDIPLGMGGILFTQREKSKHIAYIYWMYTKPEARRNGIGRAIVGRLIEYAKSNKDIRKISLNVTSTQTNAIYLYKSYGFKHVGTLQKEFYSTNQFVDLLLFEIFIDAKT